MKTIMASFLFGSCNLNVQEISRIATGVNAYGQCDEGYSPYEWCKIRHLEHLNVCHREIEVGCVTENKRCTEE